MTKGDFRRRLLLWCRRILSPRFWTDQSSSWRLYSQISASVFASILDLAQAAVLLRMNITCHNVFGSFVPRNKIISREFRRVVQRAYDEIKATHGEGLSSNVFPAIPVSAAIELGRVWMPKADLKLMILTKFVSEDLFRGS